MAMAIDIYYEFPTLSPINIGENCFHILQVFKNIGVSTLVGRNKETRTLAWERNMKALERLHSA